MRTTADEPEYDVIGIGTGPANLALLAALDDRRSPNYKALLLERRNSSSWHPDLLLPRARCQVSFLKDLATQRDPTSRWTFVNYLHERGRLSQFINLGDMTPSRIEYNDYLDWAATHLSEQIRYQTNVVGVEPEVHNGAVRRLRVQVETANEAPATLTTNHLVVATGAQPSLPAFAKTEDERIVHSGRFLSGLMTVLPDRSAQAHVVIVGGGQSAADMLAFLLDERPNVTITVVLRQYAFRPLDDSPFVNELFSPEMLTTFFDLPSGTKGKLLDQHKLASSSIVDRPLLEHLYSTLYQDRVLGKQRVKILPMHDVNTVEADGNGLTIEATDARSQTLRTLRADLAFLATGYVHRRKLDMLAGIEPFLEHENDTYVIESDWRVSTSPDFKPLVFLQGFGEDTHGMGEPHLSNIAHRAGVIVEALHSDTDQESPIVELRSATVR